MKVELIVDCRERAITAYADYLTANIKWSEMQITTGDYAITVNGSIVAIIERKTLRDYAASLKDGRISNTDKLVAMREKTNCRVFYIVETEQRAPVSLESYHGGIKYANIEANMDHQAMRWGIQFIVTHSAEETAQRLVRLVKHIETMDAGEFKGGEETLATEQLTERIAVNPDNVLLEMWAVFSGIAIVTAPVFAKATSFKSLTENPTIVDSLKVNGRAVSTRTLNNIKEGIKTPSIVAKIIACAPGLSLVSATYIAERNTLHQLCGMTLDMLKQVEYKDGKKIRGPVAETLCGLLSKQL